MISSLLLISSLLISQVEGPHLVRPDFLDPKKNPAAVVKEEVKTNSLEVTVEEKTKPFNNVEITVATTAKFVQVKAQKDLFSHAKIYEVITKEAGKRQYVFTGTVGVYVVTVSTFDETAGFNEVTKTIRIEDDQPLPPPIPTPDPVPPTPVPPGPAPVPIPPTPGDKWGLQKDMTEALSKVKSQSALAEAPEYVVIFNNAAKMIEQKKTSSEAFSYVQITIEKDITVNTRIAFNDAIEIMNTKLKANWPLAGDDLVRWFRAAANSFGSIKYVPEVKDIDVLFLYESDDLGKKNMQPLLNTIYSTKIRDFLKTHNYDANFWDDDVVTTHESAIWKERAKNMNTFKIPAMVIYKKNSAEIVEVKDMMKEDETLAELNKFSN